MSYQDLKFDEAERMLIAKAWRGNSFDWNDKSLKGIRSKIRNLHRTIQGDMCCYCRKHFADDHPLAIDIEHVLPKSRFKEFAIAAVNLTVACKRCNMTIKKNRVDFLHGVAIDAVAAISDLSDTYEIIHPNLDSYCEYISFLMVSIDGVNLRRYCVRGESAKGLRTVEYFKLRSLEVDSLDEIQGIEDKSGSDRAMEIRSLLGL